MHNKYNALESSGNHPPSTPNLWETCLPWNQPLLLFSAALSLFYYITFYGRVIHLMDGSTLFALPFTCWWAFSLFLTWALKNTAAVNIDVQVYIWTPILNSLGVYLGVELPKHMIIQFSHSVMSNSLWPHGLQHTRLPCPSPTPGACSNLCPSKIIDK